jgi:hypothetical protein
MLEWQTDKRRLFIVDRQIDQFQFRHSLLVDFFLSAHQILSHNKHFETMKERI